MAPGDKVRARAPLPQCLRVERHGVLAGTRHDGTLIGHHLSNFVARTPAGTGRRPFANIIIVNRKVESGSKMPSQQGVRHDIGDHGELPETRVGKAVERRPLQPALAMPSLLDWRSGGPRG